jgi:ABC-type transport system involved in cytochrome c biogenesis permease subunit
MKKYLPLLALLLALAMVAGSLVTPKNPGKFDVTGFGRLPVLANGRIKPLDTVARTSLLAICNAAYNSPTRGTNFIFTPDGRKLAPIEWLLDVVFRPTLADTYQVIVIDNPDVLSIFNLKQEDALEIRRFSFNQLGPKLEELERQAKLASQIESAVRSPFQRAVLQLYENLIHYQQLRHALVAPGRDDFLADLMQFQQKLPAGVAAVHAKQAGEAHDEAAVTAMTDMGEQFMEMSERTNLLVIPADNGETTGWKTAGAALLETFQRGSVSPDALAYAGLAHAWRFEQPDKFNELLRLFQKELANRYAPELAKCDAEARFNSAAPFSTARVLYVGAFFLAILSWVVWPDALGRSAFWFMIVAWLVATAGIAARMWLEGRPPVTNLYSSALFVGWVAVAFCIALEFIYRNAIGSVAAGMIGFSTLLIGHYLSLGGDTLEMMRAVLDSNFWLATHVVTVVAGYGATALAGFLALIYVFRGLFTRSLDKATADSLARMVYGIVCFATLFSFVGTVLGGIWADQSWGRFWGWDPKENGALIIVIWNAIILHARWGGMIRQRGLMCLAIGGNIVVGWSWFGVNMLGVGLHSYGFTEAAFFWLSAFVVSQLAVIALANLPLDKWRSFASHLPTPSPAK